MRECDALVNSSRSEGESNAILEAMATGTLPVVARRNDGNATLDASDLLERKARCLEITPARRIEEAVKDYERGWYELRATWVAHLMFDFEHLPLPMEYDSHYKIAIYVANSTCQEQRCTPSRERLRVPRRARCPRRPARPARAPPHPAHCC